MEGMKTYHQNTPYNNIPQSHIMYNPFQAITPCAHAHATF